ncbi:putative phage tail protein [Anaeromicropila populeti]|nr:putative phage tail protein [Anaeromicropila populeti]
MKLLPDLYQDNDTMKELQSIVNLETDKVQEALNKTINECYVSTSSELLSRYEKIYGLAIEVNKSDIKRRERIIARTRGIGTVTKKMLEDVAASYSNGEVEVIEKPEDYSFIIKFVGTRGIPSNMSDLVCTIEEIKPAHMAFSFEYILNTWNMISGLTWGQGNSYTWKQLREDVV